MAERRHFGSIYRTLPREHHFNTGTVGTIRLRHVLAEDGCKESQVALAKSLLTAPSSCQEERAYNAQLAVHWLLQAVKTGQEEAFLILKNCVNSGVGINALNHFEIEKCLKFSEKEKIARRVVFSLYRAIMSDTEELIPSDNFRERIDLMFQEKIPEKVSTDAPLKPVKVCETKVEETSPPLKPVKVRETKIQETSPPNPKHVSFSDVVSSVQSCLEGNVPLLSLKQVSQYSDCKKWLSTKYLYILWDLVLQSIEKLFQDLSTLKFLFSAILMTLLLEFSGFFLLPGSEIYHLIKKFEFLLVMSLPLLIMLSCTCQVITINFGGDNLKRWLHLINFFEPNIKSQEIEFKYLSKTVYPLLIFLVTSLIYISFLPENENLFPSIDIGILCFVLMIFVDRTILYQRYFVNISLFLNILTCLYKANIMPKSMTNVLSYLDFKIHYELGNNLHMQISFMSCLALPFVLPYLYAKMSLGKRFWHLVLLPHLMTLTWMNLACIHLSKASTTQCFFSILSWLVILVLSNYTGFTFTFLLYILMNISKTSGFFKIEFLFFILILVVLYMVCSVAVKKLKIMHENKKWSLVVCFAVLVLSYQAIKPRSVFVEETSIIPWEKYQTYCHHQAWYRTNTAEVQISCLPLKGRDVELDGTITSIDMIQVHNYLQLFADVLPEPLASWFACSVGENYISCNKNGLTPYERERCKMYETLKISQCHLHNWDVYKYQIILEVSSRTSPEVVLIADHSCSSFIRNLKEGDSLQAIGKLDYNIGSSSPVLTLKKARCASCYPNVECNINSTQSKISEYKFSGENIVWFFLAPLIQYEVK